MQPLPTLFLTWLAAQTTFSLLQQLILLALALPVLKFLGRLLWLLPPVHLFSLLAQLPLTRLLYHGLLSHLRLATPSPTMARPMLEATTYPTLCPIFPPILNTPLLWLQQTLVAPVQPQTKSLLPLFKLCHLLPPTFRFLKSNRPK